MRITTSYSKGHLLVRVEGRFDAHTVGEFLREVTDAVTAVTPNVTLDLMRVEFMDSSALAAMVTTLKRCMEHGGEVVLTGVSDSVQMILELTRLDQIFPVAAEQPR